jgi:peptidoglycan-N-acetylglucosamine deacetylase
MRVKKRLLKNSTQHLLVFKMTYHRWQKLSLFLRFSIILHGAVIVGWLLFPAAWSYFMLCLMSDHLVIFAAGMLPRCRWLGENWTRLPKEAILRHEIALTIDDGPDPEVTPQVLAILDDYHVKATFFCIGEQAQKYPDVCREIVQRGHAVENHTQHHSHYFSLLLRSYKIRAEIEAAQYTLTTLTGCSPSFFRPTAGLRNFLLAPVLETLNLRLANWTRRGFDTRETEPSRVLKNLLKNLAAGDILLLHDGHAARTADGQPIILAVLPPLLTAIQQAHLKPVTLQSVLLRTHS